MTILEMIQASLKKSGIDIKHAERIQKLFKIEKEDGIDDFVSLFKDNILPALGEVETAAQTAAKATAIAEYEATHKIKDGKAVEVEEPEKKLPDMDPALKAIFEKQAADIAALTGLVSGVVKTSTNASKLEQVKAKLTGKVDAKFLDKIAGKVNLDAENLDAEIEAQVTEFTEFKQSLINEFVGENYQQPNGKPAGERSVEEWGKFMDSDNGVTAGTVDLGLSK